MHTSKEVVVIDTSMVIGGAYTEESMKASQLLNSFASFSCAVWLMCIESQVEKLFHHAIHTHGCSGTSPLFNSSDRKARLQLIKISQAQGRSIGSFFSPDFKTPRVPYRQHLVLV